MLIAIVVGGGVLGLAKLFPVSFWGFVGFFVAVLTIGMVLWMNHKRTVGPTNEHSLLIVALPARKVLPKAGRKW